MLDTTCARPGASPAGAALAARHGTRPAHVEGAARRRLSKLRRQKHELTLDEVGQMIAAMADASGDLRNAALLSVTSTVLGRPTPSAWTLGVKLPTNIALHRFAVKCER